MSSSRPTAFPREAYKTSAGSKAIPAQNEFPEPTSVSEVIEASVPDKDHVLCGYIDQIESPTAVGVQVAGRTIKNGVRLGSWQGYEREDDCNRDPEQAKAALMDLR